MLLLFSSAACGFPVTQGDLSTHRVPLRRDDANSPYALAVSSPTDVPGNFLATQVWPSARTAAWAVERYLDLASVSILCELGCGPGLPSLTAASLGVNVIATDLDQLALELVATAAEEQGLQIITRTIDLIHTAPVEVPQADLYLLSDVFESKAVAEGAARLCGHLLSSSTATVWVFAQSDRVQRESFLSILREKLGDTSLRWTDLAEGPQRPLWLCDIDETSVKYG